MQTYGTDRKDVIVLRDDSAPVVNSALPSTGVQYVRVHMTKRWFNSYRLNQLEAWGDVIPGMVLRDAGIGMACIWHLACAIAQRAWWDASAQRES